MSWWNIFKTKLSGKTEGNLQPRSLVGQKVDICIEKKAAKPQSIEKLTNLLMYGGSDERKEAAQAFGTSGNVHAIGPLIAVLIKEAESWDGGDKQLKDTANKALERIGAVAIDPIIAAIKNNPSNLQHAVLVRALGYVADRQVAGAFLQPILTNLKDCLRQARDKRKAGIKALGELGYTEAVPLLISATQDQNEGVRRDAVDALVNLGPVAIGSLIAVLAESESGRRKSLAADILGRICDRQAVEPLVAELKNENSAVRKSAVEALTRIGDVRAVDGLIAALKDNELSVRESVVKALGTIADEKSAIPMIEALKTEKSESVQRAIGKALLQFHQSHKIEVFDSALRFGDSDTRLAALDKLSRQTDVSVVEGLIAAFSDNDHKVRENVVVHLGISRDTRALDTLIIALKDKDYSVPKRATQSLVKIGTPAVPFLINSLKDGDGQVRECAIEALGLIKDAQAVEPLIDMLNVTFNSVQKRAAEALGNMGNPQAVAALENAIKTSDCADLRISCIDALGKIGDKTAVEVLIAELKNTMDISLRRRIANIFVHLQKLELIRNQLPAIILDWLVFKPGKGADTELKLMASCVGMDNELLEISIYALGYIYSTERNDKYTQNLTSYTGGLKEIDKLCQRKDAWSSSVLFRVAKKKDVEISLGGCAFGSVVAKLNFENERQAAQQELIRRGVGETDPLILLQL